MQIAYICSPYRVPEGYDGKTAAEIHNRNVEYAKELTKKALEVGLAPITTHLYITQVTDDDIEAERQQGLIAGLALLGGCNLLILGDRYGISSGMSGELDKAKAQGITVITEAELNTAIGIEKNCERATKREEATVKAPAWIYSANFGEVSDEIYEKIEQALGFKLFIWQKTYIECGWFRRAGFTTAEIIKDLLDIEAKPLDYSGRPTSRREAIYRHELVEIKKKLDAAGIQTRKVFFSRTDKEKYERGQQAWQNGTRL